MPDTRRALRGIVPSISHVQVDSWRDRAACSNHPRLLPSAWDDSADGDNKGGRPRADDVSRREKRIRAAKKVCNTECPVRQQCLDDVDLAFDEGVRGGIDLRQLRNARSTG